MPFHVSSAMGISKRTLNKLFSATIAWQNASNKGTLSFEGNISGGI
jgi:hypothetical protein